MKVSVFIATSLDGFIARPNGSVDWLMNADQTNSGEDYGYEAFSSSVDCMVMGRNSFETVKGFAEKDNIPWPYDSKRVVVLSSTMEKPPKGYEDKIELYSGDLATLLAKLESESCQHLYVDGGQVIQSFLNQGLITDITMNRIPILIGEGIPLFGKIPKDILLKLVSSITYPSGFIMSHYQVSCN